MGRTGRITAPDTSIQPKYGRLTVVGDPVRMATNQGDMKWFVPCRCDCGTEKLIRWHFMKDGGTQSCGCIRAEVTQRVNHAKFNPNAKSKEKLYQCWRAMNVRCTDPKSMGSRGYGGRGITVCEEWRTSYPAFREWAIAAGYSDGLTIERVDVNGNYCPENCTWIPGSEQALNRRSSRRYEYQGETKLLQEWLADPRCKATSRALLYGRLVQGWSVEKAITTPPVPKSGPRPKSITD